MWGHEGCGCAKGVDLFIIFYSLTTHCSFADTAQVSLAIWVSKCTKGAHLHIVGEMI